MKKPIYLESPFHETTLGKILTSPLIKGALSLLPFGVGSIASNILDKNATGSGTIDPKTMPIKLEAGYLCGISLFVSLR